MGLAITVNGPPARRGPLGPSGASVILGHSPVPRCRRPPRASGRVFRGSWPFCRFLRWRPPWKGTRPERKAAARPGVAYGRLRLPIVGNRQSLAKGRSRTSLARRIRSSPSRLQDARFHDRPRALFRQPDQIGRAPRIRGAQIARSDECVRRTDRAVVVDRQILDVRRFEDVGQRRTECFLLETKVRPGFGGALRETASRTRRPR